MSSSEINQVLANSLSPDANLRNAAEQQLSQAAESNFPLYLATLVQELANDQTESSIRAAAGLALKNAFTTRDYGRHQELQAKWLQQTDDDTKTRVKQLTLQTLSSSSAQVGNATAQVISSIAAIELPRHQWSDLMPYLVKNVSEGADHQKQASLTTIGYICESQDAELRLSLVSHSNAILTAVVQGARKEEANEVRHAAITALGDSLEFVGNNFKHEGERNYIMQVVCEATQAEDSRIQQGAFGCLNRIMALYYDNMRYYMEKALFGLTILGMKSDDEDVAKLAVEFWCTVCEEELSIEDDNAQVDSADQMRPFFNFARVAANGVVPMLLLILTKQDEDATDDEYNLSRAAYQCLQLYAQAVSASIIAPVLLFVEHNLRSDNWRERDAAVSAFGAIMDGPDEKVLDPIVKQALPILITMMDDQSLQVRDSTAYALGRVTEACSDAIDPAQHLPTLIESLFKGLLSSAKMAPSCCWALINLAERFAGDLTAASNPLTPHFNQAVTSLLDVTNRQEADTSVRTAAYEVLNVFVQNAATESLPAIASLSEVILKRLEETVPLQSQVVSVEDKITLEEMQNSLCTVLQAIILRLDKEIAPQGDRIMQVLLQILSIVGSKSIVPEAVLGTIAALSNSIEEEFAKYMDAFAPFLYNALGNQEEPSLCSMGIGVVGDITRSMGERSQPYCDSFMNYLLNNLRVGSLAAQHVAYETHEANPCFQSTTLANQFKPAILQCFGDIAGAIGGHFETYLSVVAQVLEQASTVAATQEGPYELSDYAVSLREGIMDAWGGIIGAMKASDKIQSLQQYIPAIFSLLSQIAVDMNRSESLMRASMGVIGDLADAYPNGELVENFFRQEWVTVMIKETKTNRDYEPRTIETARWAREQVKRQLGGSRSIVAQT